MKAVFGGAQKKPLMTKVSMRHLNEIVRERNQYSRDAMEAWQDFINLKGRMDTELSKVSKRNNFLSEELESWKQQVSSRPQSDHLMSLTLCSSSNSKPSLSSSQRRPRTSNRRLKATSARTAVSHISSTNVARISLVFLNRSLALRSNVTMRSRLLFCSKKLRKSSSASVRGTPKN